MLTDYKFEWIKWIDDVETRVLVRFHEGEMREMDVRDPVLDRFSTQIVYVRTAVLARKEIVFAGKIPMEEIEKFCNKELATDTKRTPISKQAMKDEPGIKVKEITNLIPDVRYEYVNDR